MCFATGGKLALSTFYKVRKQSKGHGGGAGYTGGVMLQAIKVTHDRAFISRLISELFRQKKPIESELVQPFIDARGGDRQGR